MVVTEANQREKNLVVSRRDLLEQERAEKREQTWKTLDEGQVHKGVVRSIKDFGAFVDIGGVDGLIHVGDMAWGRVTNVGSVLKIGDEVEVKVLKLDRVTQKVGLGLKQLMASPWDRVEEKYGRGMTLTGKVTRLMDFGAFVELEPGIEGLVHISELSPSRVRRASDIVKPEQEVEVRILKIEPDAKKISLSLKPLPTLSGSGRARRRGRRRHPASAPPRAEDPPQGRPRRPRPVHGEGQEKPSEPRIHADQNSRRAKQPNGRRDERSSRRPASLASVTGLFPPTEHIFGDPVGLGVGGRLVAMSASGSASRQAWPSPSGAAAAGRSTAPLLGRGGVDAVPGRRSRRRARSSRPGRGRPPPRRR